MNKDKISRPSGASWRRHQPQSNGAWNVDKFYAIKPIDWHRHSSSWPNGCAISLGIPKRPHHILFLFLQFGKLYSLSAAQLHYGILYSYTVAVCMFCWLISTECNLLQTTCLQLCGGQLRLRVAREREKDSESTVVGTRCRDCICKWKIGEMFNL